jgi:hypothetical protein
MKSMSKFGPLDLHLFNLYLRFQLILHTLYNIAIADAQNYFLVGHYIGVVGKLFAGGKQKMSKHR